ncbi:hypothetical protein B0H13DRAFT_797677 [Mycena leptocephala]|nr:hypothetical protein B0H13DRAFT_797677 [Mycena leptocephala]
MASRGGSPFVPPLPLVIPGGMDSTDFVGGAGSGLGQTHGADIPSTAPTVRHGYFNSSLNHSTTIAPTLGHGYSNSSVNHSVRAVFRRPPFLRNRHHQHASPRARAQTLGLCYHGGGTRVRVRVRLRGDGRRALRVCGLAVREQEPAALAGRARARRGGVEAHVDGRGACARVWGREQQRQRRPRLARLRRGVRGGARGSAVYGPDSVYDARGSTLLAYVYEPRR